MNHTKTDYETGVDIVALSTPYASSALCVIRASGDGVRSRIALLFSASSKLLASKGREFFYGKLTDPTSRKVIDEIVLLYSQGPRSYTGEDVIEIMGHGSLPGIEAILQLCLGTGMRQALPGEFTFRAFVNGKMDLTQAEAVHEIVVSSNEQSHLMAMKRLTGALEQEIERLKEVLINFMAQLNLQLDYAEDDAEHDHNLPLDQVDWLLNRLSQLLGSYELAQRHKNGFRTVLVGRTNAGKSSLFNLLLRQDRSIVSDFHGTTRDYVEGEIVLSGNILHVFDTAGLRDTEEQVEQEGIRRSLALLASAQLVLYIQEAGVPFSGEDEDFIRGLVAAGQRVVIAVNKSDLLTDEQSAHWRVVLSDLGLPSLFLSTVDLAGVEDLKEGIITALSGLALPSTEGLYVESKRQFDLLTQAKEALEDAKAAVLRNLPFDLLAVDCERALSALGEITGEVTREDILERMFSSFCVGK